MERLQKDLKNLQRRIVVEFVAIDNQFFWVVGMLSFDHLIECLREVQTLPSFLKCTKNVNTSRIADLLNVIMMFRGCEE